MPIGDSEPDGKGRSVSDRAYHSLRQLILRGEFAPGEHLSGQRLSQMLGISRTPVRTASSVWRPRASSRRKPGSR